MLQFQHFLIPISFWSGCSNDPIRFAAGSQVRRHFCVRDTPEVYLELCEEIEEVEQTTKVL